MTTPNDPYIVDGSGIFDNKYSAHKMNKNPNRAYLTNMTPVVEPFPTAAPVIPSSLSHDSDTRSKKRYSAHRFGAQ